MGSFSSGQRRRCIVRPWLADAYSLSGLVQSLIGHPAITFDREVRV